MRPAGANTDKRRIALMACADASTQKSAARWLASAGFEVVVGHRRPTRRQELGRDLPAHRGDRHGRSATTAAAASARRSGAVAGSESPCSPSARASGRRGRPSRRGRPTCFSAPSIGTSATIRAERLVRLAETEGALAGARDEIETLRKAVEKAREERSGRDRFDALTGLPDGDRLDRALERALVTASETSQVAVALFDIEHLVVLNSRLGRARANSVLQQVAQRLIAGLRSEEVLRATGAGPSMSMAARLGGGLFAALLTGRPRLARGPGRSCACCSIASPAATSPGRGDRALGQRRRRPGARRRPHRRGAHPEGGAGGVRGGGERGRHPLLRPVLAPRHRAQPRHHPPARRRPSPAASSPSTTSPSWRARTRGSPPPRRCSAGSRPSWARSRPPSSCPWPRSWASWCPSGPGCCGRPARRSARGSTAACPPARIAVNVSLCQLVRGDLAQVVARVPAGDGHRRLAPGAGAERARRAAQRPRHPPPAPRHPRSSACASPSTTSAPATPPSST